jgi:CubicO group peptidase (beta-lactamase class C family)
MSIAIGKDGQIWSNGYGLSDLENFVPAKSSTTYRTASIAKPMTAVALMKLVERGKIDLDAPVQKFVPEFVESRWPVTPRQLLGHLGGVRHYRDSAEAALKDHYWSVSDAIKLFAADPVEHEPGTKYLYTTFGYVLLGRLIENLGGCAFMDCLKENVLAPAGMSSTQSDDVFRIVPNRSRGYQRTERGEVLNCVLHDTSYKIPGGGLLSTAPDLVRFAMAIDSGRLLRPESIAEMFRPLHTRDGVSTGYGLGWGTTEFSGQRAITHGGGQAGVSTVLVYLPERHTALAMMFNLEGVRADQLTRPIVDILFQ